MGRTAHSRRTENAWLRSFGGAKRVVLDAESRRVLSTHLALEKGAPAGRKAKEYTGVSHKVTSMSRLGGLYHRYNRAA